MWSYGYKFALGDLSPCGHVGVMQPDCISIAKHLLQSKKMSKSRAGSSEHNINFDASNVFRGPHLVSSWGSPLPKTKQNNRTGHGHPTRQHSENHAEKPYIFLGFSKGEMIPLKKFFPCLGAII